MTDPVAISALQARLQAAQAELASVRAEFGTFSSRISHDLRGIFRNIDGRRAGAVFDVEAIREGRVPDPQVLGGDVIVVGFDQVKGVFRDIFKTAPFFYVFRYF